VRFSHRGDHDDVLVDEIAGSHGGVYGDVFCDAAPLKRRFISMGLRSATSQTIVIIFFRVLNEVYTRM
jgi:hypothetical protein